MMRADISSETNQGVGKGPCEISATQLQGVPCVGDQVDSPSESGFHSNRGGKNSALSIVTSSVGPNEAG